MTSNDNIMASKKTGKDFRNGEKRQMNEKRAGKNRVLLKY